MRLDPLGPDHPNQIGFMAWARFQQGRFAEAIALAKESEQGFGHTAMLHSRDTSVMSRMGKIMDVTIFVQNGPCTAGLGEAYLSFSIATPTGEGVTTPLTFTRVRRSCTTSSNRRKPRVSSPA